MNLFFWRNNHSVHFKLPWFSLFCISFSSWQNQRLTSWQQYLIIQCLDSHLSKILTCGCWNAIKFKSHRFLGIAFRISGFVIAVGCYLDPIDNSRLWFPSLYLIDCLSMFFPFVKIWIKFLTCNVVNSLKYFQNDNGESLIISKHLYDLTLCMPIFF